MTTTTPRARTRNHALWLGPLLAVAGFLSYFTVFFRYPALRDVPWINLLALAAAVALSGLALARAFGPPRRWLARTIGIAGFALTALVAGFFAVYVFLISAQLPAPAAATLELEQAPEFTALDHRGRSVSLRDLRGRKVVLTFYRGYW